MMDEMDHKVQDFYALMAPSSTSRLLSATIGSKSTAKLKPLSTNSTWILITTLSFMLRRNILTTLMLLLIMIPIIPPLIMLLPIIPHLIMLLPIMPRTTLLPTIPHLITFPMLLHITRLLFITLPLLTKKAVLL